MLRASIVFLGAAALCAGATAQTGPLEFRDDVPIETYLSLLARIAPTARDGAEAFMAAFRARCGRELKAVELRRALAEGTGDPVLLGMVQASYQRDAAAIQRLAANINCSRN